MTADPTQTLRAVQLLLCDSSRWTKHRVARDIDGNKVPAYANEAKSWCLLGAIDKCALAINGGYAPASSATVRAVCQALPPWAKGSVSRFNDDPSVQYRNVMELIEQALVTCQGPPERPLGDTQTGD